MDENKTSGFTMDTRHAHMDQQERKAPVTGASKSTAEPSGAGSDPGMTSTSPGKGKKESFQIDGRRPAATSAPGGSDASNKEKAYQQMTYERVPDGVKKAVGKVLEQPSKAVKLEVVDDSDRTEDYNRLESSTRDAGTIVSGINTAARRAEIIDSLRRESGKYIAGDIFFHDGVDLGGSLVSDYVNAAAGAGVYRGVTVGVDAAFKDVCRNPEGYMLSGSLTLDPEKVMAKIRKSERFKKDGDGNLIVGADGKPVFDVPENSRWRKKVDQTLKYRQINSLEAQMRGMSGSGVFSAAEEKVLAVNNKMFDFRSRADIDATGRMIDKYFLEQIRSMDAEDIIKVYARPGILDSPVVDKMDVDLQMIRRMSSRDIGKMITELKLKDVAPELIETLKMRQMVTLSSEKIRRLEGANVKGAMFRLVGGSELLDSDMGQAMGQTRTGVRLGLGAAKTTITAGKVGKAAVVKAGDLIVPDLMDEFRREKMEKNRKRLSKRMERVQKIQSLKPVKMLRGINAEVGNKINSFRRRLSESKLGRAAAHVRRAERGAARVVRKPIVVTGSAVDTVKRKVVTPIVMLLGGLLIIMYLLASFGNVGGGVSGSILSTILSEKEQFAEYQTRYDSCDATFQAQVDNQVNGYASTTNLKGQQIRYGINTSSLTAGGLTTDPEYKNGVTLHYYYDGGETDGISSNIEDCLSAMAVIMSQAQSEHHTEALELIGANYMSTHSYTVVESSLYPCTGGCEISRYYCNEAQINYPSTDLRYSPWLYGDVYVPDIAHECEVCRDTEGMTFDQYAGCTVTGTCYHNEGSDDDNFGRRKPSRTVCSNPEPYWDCDHSCSNANCTHDCSGSTLGCAGYWYCGGHDHFGCPEGHDIKACYGHVDLDMSVYIASLNKIFDMGGVPVVEPETMASEPEPETGESDESEEGGEGA